MACDAQVDSFIAIDGELDVIDRYEQLMTATMSDESLYTRTKETIKALFDELDIPAPDKAKYSLEYISNMSIQLSSSAMQTALEWAKTEKESNYSLALLKAQTEKALAEKEVARESICNMIKTTELTCAQTEATIAASIRENGSVIAYDTDTCKPTSLANEGLKYNQTQQVKAATYQTFADAYRKSGVVQIGTDSNDQVYKGLSGGTEPIVDGYTNQQSLNAERQRIAYEDSKRNHAANSAASMIGQLLSSETLSTSNDADVQRWRNAVDYLNTSHVSTTEV